MNGNPPRYAPEVRIEIAGRPIPAQLRGSLVSVRCQTGLDAADRLELTLANEGLRWLDNEFFRLDTEVELRIGYAPNEPQRIFNGVVVGTDATFPGSGMPTLTVVAQDRRVRLQESSATRWFAIPIPKFAVLPIPDIAVAPMVALEHGLIPVLDPIGAALSVLLQGASVAAAWGDPDGMQKVIRKQHGQSNFDFLAEIAKENGWEMFVDHPAEPGGYQLRFMSPLSHLDADVTLRYGASLLDFTPKITNVGQILSIAVKVWRPEIKLELTVVVGWDWDRQSLSISISPGFGMPSALSPKAQQSILLVQEPLTLASAPRVIVGKLLPKLNRRQTATGTTIGDARIQAGKVLQIEGVGETYGGRYRVAGATHTLDGGGYRTSFDLRKEIWFGSIPSPSQGAIRINEGLLTLDAQKSAALMAGSAGAAAVPVPLP
jgi:hypothetical protein